MTKGELIKQLEQYPDDMPVNIFDSRMNCHFADGDGARIEY